MLSGRSDRAIIRIYGIGFALLLLIGAIMIYFYNNLQHENVKLAKQKRELLLEKAHYTELQNKKVFGEINKHSLFPSELCVSSVLLKQKIIFWIHQSEAQLITLRVGTGITVRVVGGFYQDVSLLIALANARIIFDINTIELSAVKNGIELRIELAHDVVCD